MNILQASPADGVRVEEEHGGTDDPLQHAVVQPVRCLRRERWDQTRAKRTRDKPGVT